LTFLCVHVLMRPTWFFWTYVYFSACIHKIYDMVSVILLLVSLFVGS
jgi:hypothetical protein